MVSTSSAVQALPNVSIRFLEARTLFAAILIALFFAEALLLFDGIPLFSKFIRTLDPSVFPDAFPGAYGHPFWLLLASAKEGAELAELPVVLTLVLLFLAFKYIAAIFWRETLALRLQGDSANAFALALLASPGLFFYGKIVSPEFQTLALVSAGTYFAVRAFMRRRQVSWLGLVLLFLAAYAKITNLPFFAAAWLASGITAYRNGSAIHALRTLTAGALVFVGAAYLACAAAGGVSVTAQSVFILPTPPAIFEIGHLWRNLNACPPFTWDQVKLLPLATAFPILFIVIAAAPLAIVLRRRSDSAGPKISFLWILLLSALAALGLLLAKSMNYTWYLFVPATTASLAICMLAGPSLGRRGSLAVAALAMTLGISPSLENLKAELQKRALVLDGAAHADELIKAAQDLCGHDGVRVVLDMLIPATQSADRRILPLRYAVQMPEFKEDIARNRPIVFISHEQLFTQSSPVELLSIQPATARFKSIRHPAHKGYVFRVGEGC